MPGWHITTEPVREKGLINVYGIVEEQHPDRARLFMQWKNMDWPVLVDSMNLLETRAVPLTILLDPDGTIVAINPTQDTFGKLIAELESNGAENPQDRWSPRITEAEKMVLAGTPDSLSTAIGLFEKSLESLPQESGDYLSGLMHFRLGVALKARDESTAASPTDFSRALHHWQSALAADPNQYIWRRRIQQYGPRLDKPYPFYNWIEQALREIADRGETPVKSTFPLTGSESASPSGESPKTETGNHTPAEPDPDGRLNRVAPDTIRVSTVTIPENPAPGRTARIHIRMELSSPLQVSWNNEAAPSGLWVSFGDGKASPLWIPWTHYPVDTAYSTENRLFDFEWRQPEGSNASPPECYAIVNLCNRLTGLCYTARVDIPLSTE